MTTDTIITTAGIIDMARIVYTAATTPTPMVTAITDTDITLTCDTAPGYS